MSHEGDDIVQRMKDAVEWPDRQAIVDRAKVAVRIASIEGAQRALRSAAEEWDGSVPWRDFLTSRADALEPRRVELMEATGRRLRSSSTAPRGAAR